MKESPLAIRNVRIYLSPDLPPIERGSLVAQNGRITALGASVPVPPGAVEVPAEGCVLTAGFWNTHVHFTERRWSSAGRQPAAVLNAQLQAMFTSRGFTTVVDTGSDPRITLALRRRIQASDVTGPSIYTSGSGLFPPKGIPYYLRRELPFWLRPLIPQPSTPAAAERIVRKNLAHGTDLVKLFTGSYVERGKVKPMPEPIARAAVNVAHAHGRLVFSHPSDLEGTRIAVRSGVDVLAHPPDTTEGIDRSVVQQMVDHRMAMIPTLKMFSDSVTNDPGYLEPIYEVVRQFRALGGQLLFGTDVGYLTDHSTEGEFQGLVRCGLDAPAILRTLTSAPAQRFGVGTERGAIAVGARADLTLLEGDPWEDPLAFARVRATVRGGEVLYLRSGGKPAGG
jgi:imidazolonepropionase-like amidohydrolase